MPGGPCMAYWTNTAMIQAEAGFSPRKPVDIRLTYYHMSAFHSFAGDPKIFSSGTRRGDMFQARVDLKVNKNFRGHLLYENLIPGNYYRDRDDGYYLRFEIIYSLGGKILSSPRN